MKKLLSLLSIPFIATSLVLNAAEDNVNVETSSQVDVAAGEIAPGQEPAAIDIQAEAQSKNDEQPQVDAAVSEENISSKEQEAALLKEIEELFASEKAQQDQTPSEDASISKDSASQDTDASGAKSDSSDVD